MELSVVKLSVPVLWTSCSMSMSLVVAPLKHLSADPVISSSTSARRVCGSSVTCSATSWNEMCNCAGFLSRWRCPSRTNKRKTSAHHVCYLEHDGINSRRMLAHQSDRLRNPKTLHASLKSNAQQKHNTEPGSRLIMAPGGRTPSGHPH